MSRVGSPDLLAAALRLAEASLNRTVSMSLASAADDPLRLALPPLGPQDRPGLTTRGVSAFAALYLHAELEIAGVLPVTESLADNRHLLALRDTRTLSRIDTFAREASRHPSRHERAVLYARLFGIGEAARADPRHASRIDFMQRLLRLASAMARADGMRDRQGRASVMALEVLRATAGMLTDQIAAQPEGFLHHQAQRIHERTVAAFGILGDEGLRRALNAPSAWAVLQKLSQGLHPDMDQAARRGATGQTLLRWVATVLPVLGDPLRELPLPDPGTVGAAYRWMGALGLPVRQDTASSPASHEAVAA